MSHRLPEVECQCVASLACGAVVVVIAAAVAAGCGGGLQLRKRMTRPCIAITQHVPPYLQLLQLRLSCATRPFGCCRRLFSSVYGIFCCLQPCKPCIAVLHSKRRAAERSCIASLGAFIARPGGLQLPRHLLERICLLLGRSDAEVQPPHLFGITVDLCRSIVCNGMTPRNDKARSVQWMDEYGRKRETKTGRRETNQGCRAPYVQPPLPLPAARQSHSTTVSHLV